ncbi:hypothetical protein SAMN04488105_101129 [Salipiger thiooxidans]|uniref:Short chain dehydrogenase n=1 Tax=Salipiger thiooxidans TaxID=282683 RepID=A0A1G7AFU9_9RHOB|nr:hypothetical protein [Salipiger thiooxidans]SDE13808.1 hypothetical protein SAMN04488105_101129 [Salipiger thiooxidans]
MDQRAGHSGQRRRDLTAPVLITGAPSGFGALIARELANDGHHVFASVRDSTAYDGAPAAGGADLAADGQHIETLELDVPAMTRSPRPRRT